VRETYYSTALSGSDPNYLRKASMEGNAVVRFEFLHVGDGRRADSSTRFPGASSLRKKRSITNYDAEQITDRHIQYDV
jgi:hypothetical protein